MLIVQKNDLMRFAVADLMLFLESIMQHAFADMFKYNKFQCMLFEVITNSKVFFFSWKKFCGFSC